MRLLVTRPEADAERTAAALRERGHEVVVAPVLDIVPIAADLGDGPWAGLLLTSGNAIGAIAAHPRLSEFLKLPVLTVGARTAERARAAGFSDVTSAGGDQHDLAALAAKRAGAGVLLHFAGEDLAGDLATDLAPHGLTVRTVAIYRAVPVAGFPPTAREALKAGRIDGVLHYSRRSAEAFLACAAGAGITRRALQGTHYCLSPEVAAALVGAAVRIAEHPSEAALLALL